MRCSPRSEDMIQRAVFAHLRMRAVAGVFAFHPANGGFRRPIEAKILVGLGVVAGVPDIIAIKDGRTYALEIKTEDGRLTDRQCETIELMRGAGATIAVAFGIDEAIAALETWGLLRGTTSSWKTVWQTQPDTFT
jgi:hypothetical protein